MTPDLKKHVDVPGLAPKTPVRVLGRLKGYWRGKYKGHVDYCYDYIGIVWVRVIVTRAPGGRRDPFPIHVAPKRLLKLPSKRRR